MKKITSIVFFIFYSLATLAQHQERNLFIYNTIFGGVTGGVGAVINKSKNENWKRALLRGFWQGSVGGSLMFAGKKTLYLVNQKENIFYGWPAKILHSAGTSIVNNAAINAPFLQKWNIDYGPVRVDVSTRGDKKIRARFLPWTIYSVIASAKNSVFDLSGSLKSGELIFRHKKPYISTNRGDFLGMNYGRSFTYTTGPDRYFIMAHELVHSFQFREYQVLNTWLKPLAGKVRPSKTKHFVERYIYPDVPYMWSFYSLEGYHNSYHYFRNFFEYEAQRFASGRYVKIR